MQKNKNFLYYIFSSRSFNFINNSRINIYFLCNTIKIKDYKHERLQRIQ